jgi:uncharacterized Rossmann fold enzyme
MLNRDVFERNLLALGQSHPELCARLSNASCETAMYTFTPSKKGLPIPAIRGEGGKYYLLQSIIDPQKEASRLLQSITGQCFLIIFGLAGGDLVATAMADDKITSILIIEYGIDGLAELLAAREYQHIFSNPKVSILVDESGDSLERYIQGQYKPVFDGGLTLLPHRQRLHANEEDFKQASRIIKKVIDSTTKDFSVQSHFGRRWFINAVKNLNLLKEPIKPLRKINSIIIAAAGPSLNDFIHKIKNRESAVYLLSTDTALGALLENNIIPEGVISIDCQQISYLHFLGFKADYSLFLDLASPRNLSDFNKRPIYMASAHPFFKYVFKYYRNFINVDVSGGNVSHAALSLALEMGAKKIDIYGADFGYPQGSSYARGTYLHKLFSLKENRLNPIENQFRYLIMRNPTTKFEKTPDGWRYGNATLDSYRDYLSLAFGSLPVSIFINDRPLGQSGEGPGPGKTLNRDGQNQNNFISLFGVGRPKSSLEAFITNYIAALQSLPPLFLPSQEYFNMLEDAQKDAFSTLLPFGTFLRNKHPHISFEELFQMTIEKSIRILRKYYPF